eukprot:CAMPEP_0170541162 /NCGR_PEP_ID=MMETSP0211-20121228/967_1 /TAXON_ID=311385 /ORGANISM="Pseudokeronopsis sp., Strain OXSARD2" /LENGTH=123 /DNA_ID=CAMNT_0010843789 /DNA_START=1069 /DNA_END=1440 /DNA_ORIENTATION=+
MESSSLKAKPSLPSSNKDEAAIAQKKLFFKRELGDNVSADFFISKQARMMEYEEKNNPLVTYMQNQFQKNNQFNAPYQQMGYQQAPYGYQMYQNNRCSSSLGGINRTTRIRGSSTLTREVAEA